jgi:hypothetical protein
MNLLVIVKQLFLKKVRTFAISSVQCVAFLGGIIVFQQARAQEALSGTDVQRNFSQLWCASSDSNVYTVFSASFESVVPEDGRETLKAISSAALTRSMVKGVKSDHLACEVAEKLPEEESSTIVTLGSCKSVDKEKDQKIVLQIQFGGFLDSFFANLKVQERNSESELFLACTLGEPEL